MAMRIMAASAACRRIRPWRRSCLSGNPPKPAGAAFAAPAARPLVGLHDGLAASSLDRKMFTRKLTPIGHARKTWARNCSPMDWFCYYILIISVLCSAVSGMLLNQSMATRTNRNAKICIPASSRTVKQSKKNSFAAS